MKTSTANKMLDPDVKLRLEAAVKELFSQQDFHQVNMRGIAQKAGIGLNTIYMHYESKEQLLFSFIDEWIQALDSRLTEHLQGLEDIREKIRKTMWVMFDFYEKNPQIAAIVMMTVPFKTWVTDTTFKQKDLSERIMKLFREGKKKGLLNPGIPVEIMFDVMYGIMHRSVYIWLYLNQKKSLISSANMYCDIVWRAIESTDHRSKKLK